MTVFENSPSVARARRHVRGEIGRAVREKLGLVQSTQHRAPHAGNLSGGMRKRVGLARIDRVDPK